MHIITYYEVERHLREKPINIGAYVCSCGYYYLIPPCGFPWEQKDKKQTFCPICKKPIGYSKKKSKKGQHGMALRKGHYRVFKNIEDKTQQLKLYGDTDENISSIILSDYKKNIIDPILKKSRFEINKPSKKRFQNKNQKIRNLSLVGYRLLNFILYSHLFFSICLGYIDKENMKNYILKC